MELFRKLVAERAKAGLTQEQLAERVGVTPRTISKWEAGSPIQKTRYYELLAQQFNVSMDYLMKDTVNSKNDTQMYTQLGRNVSTILNFSTAENFWMNFALCEKETTLLLPVNSTNNFMSQLRNFVEHGDKYDKAKVLDLNKLSRDFILHWYQFNRLNIELSSTSKTALLADLQKVFITNPDASPELPLFPKYPAILLRNSLYLSIFMSRKFDNYKVAALDTDTAQLFRKFSTSFLHSLQVGKFWLERDNKSNL